MSEKSDQHGEESGETDLVETGAADFAQEFEPSSSSLEAEIGGSDLSGTEKGVGETEKGSGGGLGVRELAIQAIKEKLANKKSLTAAEWKILEQEEKGAGPSDDGKIWVKTQVELAESLGVDRRSVSRYLAEPGNPGRAADGRYDLKVWRDWVRAKGTVRAAAPSEKERLELEILRSENETKKIKLAEARGEMVSLDEAMLVLGGMFAEIRPRLQQLKHDLVPKLVGLPVEDAMEKMQAALNQVLGEVAVPGEAKKKVFWRSIAEQFLRLQAS